MNNDSLTKVCGNCRYFKRYYVLNVCLRFVPVNEGFCCHRKTGRRATKRNVIETNTCEWWQSNELQKLKDQYIAENVLKDTNKKLEAIRVLLSEDQ